LTGGENFVIKRTIYILFQVWGSTLHWVLVLHKLWSSMCCPGCTAVAAYERYHLLFITVSPTFIHSPSQHAGSPFCDPVTYASVLCSSAG